MDVSSDTSGSVPVSPADGSFSTGAAGPAAAADEDTAMPDRAASTCLWDGCGAGELDHMDALVQHLENDHVQGRSSSGGRKYVCEWRGCARKGVARASVSALRTHLRSHTHERPFVCSLPGGFAGGLVEPWTVEPAVSIWANRR